MLLIIAMAFIAGLMRSELVLILVGAVFTGVMVYSFFGITLIAFMHRKKRLLVSAQPSPVMIEAGQAVSFSFSRNGAGRFFRLPGICVRYELALSTKDGRKWQHYFDPDRPDSSHPNPAGRGAYYGETDYMLVFDVLGFFKKALAIPQDIGGPRLLAAPAPVDETVCMPVRAGGRENRTEPNFTRTDDLIEHRPYIPGDDPRRINWKLYGHARDLFVREGEPEPPPQSELVILLDTSVDTRLFKREAAVRGVDALCAHALALALEQARQGRDIWIGYNGSQPKTGNSRELAEALAHPAAICHAEKLPQPGEKQGAAIFALPRMADDAGVLDDFLRSCNGRRDIIELCFIYEEGNDKQREAAEFCVSFYNNKGGIYAQCCNA